MMQIELEKVSKRYRYEWIFKALSYQFLPKRSYALVGHNGSGKSTLLQILSGFLSPSKGTIRFLKDQQVIDRNEVYQHISFCSPYLELTEELSLREAIRFHQRFKPLLPGFDQQGLLDVLGLPNSAKDKAIQFFSSGMKQRLKLALAVASDTPVLLLDEPTVTLDQQGVHWYQELITQYAFGKRLVVIASNVEKDLEGCEERLSILDYK